MKRLGRIIFNSLTVLSLVLCVAMAGLWVRSYWRWDLTWWGYNRHRPFYVLWAYRGQVRAGEGIFTIEYQFKPPLVGASDWGHLSDNSIPGLSPLPHQFMGMGWGRSAEMPWEPVTPAVGVPMWISVVVLGVLPAVRFYRGLRNRRRAAGGQCVECGYDLRASSGRCPECGVAMKNVAVLS